VVAASRSGNLGERVGSSDVTGEDHVRCPGMTAFRARLPDRYSGKNGTEDQGPSDPEALRRHIARCRPALGEDIARVAVIRWTIATMPSEIRRLIARLASGLGPVTSSRLVKTATSPAPSPSSTCLVTRSISPGERSASSKASTSSSIPRISVARRSSSSCSVALGRESRRAGDRHRFGEMQISAGQQRPFREPSSVLTNDDAVRWRKRFPSASASRSP